MLTHLAEFEIAVSLRGRLKYTVPVSYFVQFIVEPQMSGDIVLFMKMHQCVPTGSSNANINLEKEIITYAKNF